MRLSKVVKTHKTVILPSSL